VAKKVYLAASGEYSDYRILAAFTTKELAQAFVDESTDVSLTHRAYLAEVEEYELFDRVPRKVLWHFIEQILPLDKEPRRRIEVLWEFENPYYAMKKRAVTFRRWVDGYKQTHELAFGTDPAAVEKVWKEQHAAQEALEAGL
jgi:hypothetical protein